MGSTVEQLSQVQEYSSTDEGLTPIGDLTYSPHTPPYAGWITNQGGLGTLGLDSPDPQHKEDSLVEPNPQMAIRPPTVSLDLLEPNTKVNELGPFGAQHKEDSRHFWEGSSLGPKVGLSTASLDLDPCILKSTLYEPPLGPCLDMENDRYENPPSPSSPFVFGQTPLEEFVCLGGPGLPETVECPLPLTILPTETDLSVRFSEETETKFSNEDSTIKVLDNPMKPPDFSEEALHESGM